MIITNEISQVGGGGLTSPEDAAVYLINFGGYAALKLTFSVKAITAFIKEKRKLKTSSDLL